MTLPKLKLTYFDMDGGRGEAARLAMHLGGVEWEDHRISFEEFGKTRESFPFGRVPVLEVDGQILTQSAGIERFVGRLAGVYPDDPWQAAQCDETVGTVEDVVVKIVATFFITDETKKKAAREELAEGELPFVLSRLNAVLENRGGEYFVGGKLSIADLKVFVCLAWLRSGNLDYLPTDLPEKHAPLLVALADRVTQRVSDYYAKRV